MLKDKTLLFVFLSLALLILDYFSLLNFMHASLDRMIVPVKQNVFTIATSLRQTGNVFLQYRDFSLVVESNGKLKKETAELQLKVQNLSEENNALRNQLRTDIPRTFQLIPAQVISVSRFMEIGIGETGGVKKGMVIVSGSALVGKVVHVAQLRSQVMLLTDPDMRVPAKTSRGTRGIIVGQSNKNILLDVVLQKDPLFLADQVVTSGEDNFPPNMLIGMVAYINSDDVSVYKQAKVDKATDYKQENVVFVAKGI